ncbi:MAG: glycosyltransferase [Deltaproteobacteria bacterium]|nr:glycosyltransferase [Deltaproteobacteria bacterium]
MRAAINLPSLRAYRDLLLVACELSERLDLLYVLTGEPEGDGDDERALDALARARPRLRLVRLPRDGYIRHASAWAAARARAGAVDLLHDHLGHLTRAFEEARALRARPRPAAPPCALLTAQLTTNWGWFERVLPLGYDLSLNYARLRAQSLWYDARVTRAADRVVVLGPGHERDLVEGLGVPAARVTYVPAETDSDLFCPHPDGLDAERDPHLILYTGALSRNKGLHTLLAAFAALSRERPALRLRLIGRVPPFERAWLEGALGGYEARHRLERLDAAPREALVAECRAASVYAFPSLFEGCPRSLREAMACGCVPVASDIPGCRGADPDGVAARFVPPNAPAALAAALSAALDEPAATRLARRGRARARVVEAHAVGAVAARYAALYRELLEEVRAP